MLSYVYKIFLLIFILLRANAYGYAEQAYIAVGKAKTLQTMLQHTVQYHVPAHLSSYADTLIDTIHNDINFLDTLKISKTQGSSKSAFQLLSHVHMAAEGTLENTTSLHPSFLITLTLKSPSQSVILEKKYTTTAQSVSFLGHRISNDLVKAITGKPGFFLTRMVAVCDLTGHKELYTMLYNGSDIKRLTNHRSIVLSPAWSPDGKKIAYSVYTTQENRKKNINLYEINFTTSKTRLLSNANGINSGATYTPDGSSIVFTKSSEGMPMLYLMNLLNLQTTRLSPSSGYDVEPHIHPQGKKIIFTSSRSGSPMVYQMPLPEKPFEIPQPALDTNPAKLDPKLLPERLTYAGKYNASPQYAPDGKTIVFAGWIDLHFDIFSMQEDGTNIMRLTRGNNNAEDPVFSPDGNYILFSSKRYGYQDNKKSLYIINRSGEGAKRITYGLGNCTSPRWSPIVE